MEYLKYIGIPYRDHGDHYDGCDCYGICKLVYKDQRNIELPDYGFLYASSGNTVEAADTIKSAHESGNNWTAVDGELEPFDILLFEVMGFISHVGVYIGDNLFLHCMKGKETCLENINSADWTHRYRGAFRWTA